jgi:hypothetical protein
MPTTFYELLDVQSIDQTRASLEQLVRRLSDIEAAVDPTTGAVSIDRDAIAGAISDTVPLEIGGRMLAEIRDILDGGMVVTDSGPAFPWALLTIPGGATALGAEPLRQLGLPVDQPPDLWSIELTSRFPGAPSQVTSTDVGQFVSNGVALQAALLPSSTEALMASTPVLSARQQNGGGGDGEGGGGGTGGGGGGGGGISLEIVNQVIGCFANAQYEPYWWGLRIGLDATCANLFADLLTGAAAGTVLSALGAAFGAVGGGLVATVGAVVAAAGGWAIAIIAICAYIFGRWLKSVVTAAGAYIDCTWIGPVAWGR